MATSGDRLAMICAAKIPVFFAPALPIAIDATGIPPGIWTVERSESSPLRGEELIGTPMTGRIVSARNDAGPRDDDLSPSLFGFTDQSFCPFRRAVGRGEGHFIRDPELLQHFGRFLHDIPI